MTYELTGYSTDRRSEDIRYRAYTASKIYAERFKKIPKIQFSDSGYGVVFSAWPHKGAKLPRITILWEYVGDELRKIIAIEKLQKKTQRKEITRKLRQFRWAAESFAKRHNLTTEKMNADLYAIEERRDEK